MGTRSAIVAPIILCLKARLSAKLFTILKTLMKLSRVNFRKDFCDCYWGQGKQIGQ